MNISPELVNNLNEPLENPVINIPKPYRSKIDDQIDEILAGYKPNDGSRGLSSFTLLDSTVIIPPVIDKYKTAYYQEAHIYGDNVDLYIYDNPKIKHKFKRSKSKCRDYIEVVESEVDRSNEYRRRNSIRAVNILRRLCLLNFSTENAKLLTLTFGNCDFDITDPKICNKKLSKFLEFLRKKFPNFKYIGVIEFQKRGAVHYHIICDLPFIEKETLERWWKHGFIDIRKLDYLSVNYLYKYIEKSVYDYRFKGIRVFFHSKNLKKPIKITGLAAFNKAKDIINSQLIFANEYNNKYTKDHVKYRQFKTPSAQKE